MTRHEQEQQKSHHTVIATGHAEEFGGRGNVWRCDWCYDQSVLHHEVSRWYGSQTHDDQQIDGVVHIANVSSLRFESELRLQVNSWPGMKCVLPPLTMQVESGRSFCGCNERGYIWFGRLSQSNQVEIGISEGHTFWEEGEGRRNACTIDLEAGSVSIPTHPVSWRLNFQHQWILFIEHASRIQLISLVQSVNIQKAWSNHYANPSGSRK